jgi:O-acetyl-ADP-ribose deacetylase (regulator of RNase III)
VAFSLGSITPIIVKELTRSALKVVHGDLLRLALGGAFDVIVHGCNCQHTMGKGIALAIKQQFPEAYLADCATPKGGSKMGSISTAEITRGATRFVVVNAYTQLHWRGPEASVDYVALRQAMRKVKRAYTGAKVGYPRIGAGLGRGDWDRIAEIISEELAGEDHTLVEFDPPLRVNPERLRSVKYTYLFPVADSRGRSSGRRSGDISDLFRDANSYLFSADRVPPLLVINEFLAKGVSHLGMGGGAEWKPFSLTEAEYSTFLRYLDTPIGRRKFHRKKPVEVANPPAEVRSTDDYSQWSIKDAMTDPNHHLNTTKVFAIINGQRVTTSLGESLLAPRDAVWHVIRDNG